MYLKNINISRLNLIFTEWKIKYLWIEKRLNQLRNSISTFVYPVKMKEAKNRNTWQKNSFAVSSIPEIFGWRVSPLRRLVKRILRSVGRLSRLLRDSIHGRPRRKSRKSLFATYAPSFFTEITGFRG